MFFQTVRYNFSIEQMIQEKEKKGLDHNERSWQLKGKGKEKNQRACTQNSDT